MKDKYLYWLDRIEGLGNVAKRNLLEAFGSARELYEGQEKYVKYILDERKLGLFLKARKELEVERAFETACREGIEFVCCFEEAFPKKLQNIPDAPFGLYYKGSLPLDELPAVAVIGARECSGYGEYVAGELGKMLGDQGIQVISGMAKGIDGISQSAALDAGGVSYGVLGCGVDVCYPKSNKRLYEELIQRGGILSTYPPGTQPQARLFPPRNRIVSGLADVLVVIEARQKSGTYITVEMALEQGRDIYAVPGRVTDRLSDGCNKMLKEGAHVFLSPQDFLMDLQELMPFRMEELKRASLQNKLYVMGGCKEEIGRGSSKDIQDSDSKGKEPQSEQGDELTGALCKLLDFYPKSVEELVAQLKEQYKITQKPEELTAQLMLMCLYGLAVQESAGWFRKA
ncbi:MAG: DNA-processing protein DprA [Lachnospiraceae bacterium]|nr:DNA-processing protein DprA [Lachnospiraceae bacterium]